MGCVGIKKERTKTELPIIDNPDADKTAMEYLQLDSQIKELTERKESLKEGLSGLLGVTVSGFEIKWTPIQSNTVDKEAVEKALGFVPTKQGKESARLSIRHNGGNN
jgi:hypothetical protein